MKKILFYGDSTDVVIVEDLANPLAKQRFEVMPDRSPAAVFLVTDAEANALLVFAHYDSQDCWYFGVGRLAGGMPLPGWRVSVGTDDAKFNPDTTVLIVEVPDSASVDRFDYEEELEPTEHIPAEFLEVLR